MEETVKQRLVKYLKYKKIGQNKFESIAGISNGYISNLKSAPGVNILTKILTAAPDLNRDWLVEGKGEMLTRDVVPVRQAEFREYEKTKSGNRFYRSTEGHIVMQVPIVPIEALGSPDDEYATIVNDYEGETTLFEVDEVHHGKYLAFRVNGDSMDDGTRNSFERGDIVLVRELTRDKWLPRLHYRDWPYWVIVFGNNVRIKQIISQDENKGTITLHSLNPSPEYTDFTLHLDQISRLFNVVKKKPRIITYG